MFCWVMSTVGEFPIAGLAHGFLGHVLDVFTAILKNCGCCFFPGTLTVLKLRLSASKSILSVRNDHSNKSCVTGSSVLCWTLTCHEVEGNPATFSCSVFHLRCRSLLANIPLH